jgi:TPR repeat protein
MKRPFLFLAALSLAIAFAGKAEAGFGEGERAYRQGNYAAAAREFEPLAKDGHTMAQYYLGLVRAKGDGAVRDLTQAYRLLNCAARNAGDPDVRANASKWRGDVKAQMRPREREEADELAKLSCGGRRAARADHIIDQKYINWLKPGVLFTGEITLKGIVYVARAAKAGIVLDAVTYMSETYDEVFIAGLSVAWWASLLGAWWLIRKRRRRLGLVPRPVQTQSGIPYPRRYLR